MNAIMEYVIGKLECLGFVVPLQGLSIQRICGDADNGLTASVSIGDDETIEFGLTERTDGSASNVLHCVIDTEHRKAWLTSDVYANLNGERDVELSGNKSLQELFERLQEFLMVRREPLHLEQIIAGLPGCIDNATSRSLIAAVLKRFGLESVYMPPIEVSTDDTAKPEVALHDMVVLARYAREEMLANGNDLCRIKFEDTSELLIFPPEVRAIIYAAAKIPSSSETMGGSA